MNVALRPEPLGPSGDPGPLDVISLCTGGFGLDLALELAVPGARSVCLVEREAFAVAHLVSAMGQGLIHPAPVWSDARTFNGRAWRGCVDGVIGGIPCQPHSLAGRKQGSLDARDLWSDARRIIVQSRAWFVLIENVGGMLSAGADEIAGAERVRRDLLKMGFAVEGGLFTASEVGASHERERLFILGVADDDGGGGAEGRGHGSAGQWRAEFGSTNGCFAVADAGGAGSQGRELVGSSGEGDGTEASRPASELCRASLVHPERAEWRPGAVRRHERHGTDGGRDQAAGRAGKSGEAMGDAAVVGRREGWAEPIVRGGRHAAAGTGEPVGYADFAELRQEPSAGQFTQLQHEHGAGGFPGIFAPGPADIDGWRRILAHSPDLEPSVRRMADGLAARVDLAGPHAARTDRLRMLGNGVVPLEGAYAIRALGARLARSGHSRAGQLFRMMGL